MWWFNLKLLISFEYSCWIFLLKFTVFKITYFKINATQTLFLTGQMVLNVSTKGTCFVYLKKEEKVRMPLFPHLNLCHNKLVFCLWLKYSVSSFQQNAYLVDLLYKNKAFIRRLWSLMLSLFKQLLQGLGLTCSRMSDIGMPNRYKYN